MTLDLTRTLAVLSLAMASMVALAQSPAATMSPQPAASKPTVVAVKPAAPMAVSKPGWTELTAPQQKALKPLAATWNSISEPQKRKWLEISKNYPALSPAGQATMHSRMNEWVAMSPQDRAAARLNFAKTKELSKQLTPDEKKAKWETYQALSPEEKAKLAAKGSPKPTGAATAVKPVPTQKLAVTPKGLPPLPKVPPGPPVTTTGETVLGVITPPGKPN
jgi:Spy/CpxP family protein refolding chaperone